MTSVQSGIGEPRSGLAIAGGILAGLLTLAVVGGGLLLAGRSDTVGVAAEPDAEPQIGAAVSAAALDVGDCVDFNLGAQVRTQFTLAACDGPHIAEITSKIEHPDAGDAYPGADAMGDWIAGRCSSETEQYIGTPTLQTTLANGALLPDFDSWSNGNYQAACYVNNADSTSLTVSVKDKGNDYLRGEQVTVSRLLDGDCFAPLDGTSSYDLNSNSTVNLTPCDAGPTGVFFGRDRLDFAFGTLFPGEDAVGDATSRRCAELFEEHFGVPASGFNYRYWRPNQQSWDLDDRNILCAVLDSEPLAEAFDPSQHQPFFDVAIGDCFNLGPEETDESLRLDDQVRVTDCATPHVGQMIGSGNLAAELGEPFPAEDGVLELAGAECERLFEEFVGVSPYESELGNFPFWYPNEPGWEDGDRRYACAFLDDEPRTVSLQGTDG